MIYYNEKLYKQLTDDKNFMEFAKEEFEERKSIKGICKFYDNFEDDLKYNLDHYNTMWEDEKMFNELLTMEEEKRNRIMQTALKQVLKEFN